MSRKPNIVDGKLSFGNLTPINKNRISKLVQHHMAHKSWTVQQVHNFHRDSNKWVGIGYNWWIAFDGTIYKGRGWNVGAHCAGNNSTTLGIGYQGDFTSQSMTDAQVESGAALNAWLMSQCPNIKSANDIIGHKDIVATACPGKHFRMTDLKDMINNQSKKSSTPKQPNKTPQPSNTNTYIRTFQTWINSNYKSKLATDNIYGNLTKREAIRAYQKELNKQFKAGLVEDGIWGNNTLNATRVVRHGARGNITYILQGMLYCHKLDPNGFDGIFGNGCENAVKKFQRQNKLVVDGLVGRDTWSRLFR
ncbi:N-acetylmuramoyl-L-alanine amidase [Alkalihalobacillus trypoxylicola]|uniref:Autolysin n=1 Tax=Alkalihalobacillus trypoxylicola TaxID=519424 RepID=A0A162F6J5_9BACI|nr:N-acetylmuramoyl-L-alanine amidase [Alkalihalobacillus trypoxylicola]KYG34900.1 hypothetical protein AZF04_00780 [Alkalihalobacillus trypoxylicola]